MSNQITTTQATRIAELITGCVTWERGNLVVLIQESALDEANRQYINLVWSARGTATELRNMTADRFDGMLRADRLMPNSRLHIYINRASGARITDYFVD